MNFSSSTSYVHHCPSKMSNQPAEAAHNMLQGQAAGGSQNCREQLELTSPIVSLIRILRTRSSWDPMFKLVELVRPPKTILSALPRYHSTASAFGKMYQILSQAKSRQSEKFRFKKFKVFVRPYIVQMKSVVVICDRLLVQELIKKRELDLEPGKLHYIRVGTIHSKEKSRRLRVRLFLWSQRFCSIWRWFMSEFHHALS